jgi:hypothetical protein
LIALQRSVFERCVVLNRFRLTGWLVLAAMLLALTAACDGPPPKPPTFNNRIAVNNAKWNIAVSTFKNTIDPLSKGTDVSPGAAQQAYDALAREFKQVKRASRHMPVPTGSPKGQAYLTAYQDYLDVEDDLMENEVKRIVATVSDSKLSPQQKWATISYKIYADIEKKQKPARDKLLGAQNEFGSAHKLSFQAPPSGK